MKNYIPVTFLLQTHSMYAFSLSILFLVHFMPNFWGSKVSLFVDILNTIRENFIIVWRWRSDLVYGVYGVMAWEIVNGLEFDTMLFYLVTVGACLLCRVSPVVPWNKKVFVSCCTRPQLDSLNYDGVHCALLRQKSWWAGPLILTYPLLFSFGRG